VERGALGPDGHVAPGRGQGLEYWVQEARACLPPDAPGPRTTGWVDWRLDEVDGPRLVADPTRAPRLPGPPYPVHRSLAPGQCARGWWAVPVPHR
jgi:hypothetical protein